MEFGEMEDMRVLLTVDLPEFLHDGELDELDEGDDDDGCQGCLGDQFEERGKES